MKIVSFLLEFHWNMFMESKYQYDSIGSDDGLATNRQQAIIWTNTGFYTKGRPLVKSNLICSSDKLSWQPGCPVLNTNIQGNFCISQGYGSSDNLPENLV